jgi:hypothetical protein
MENICSIQTIETEEIAHAFQSARFLVSRYSVFDSGAYRNHDAEWLFPQEKATLHDPQMATCESKTL